MDQDVPTPKAPRRWLKSLIVLLIGLAYLAVVYWASPALRDEMRLRSVWYGWPWLRPPQDSYRVRGAHALRGFEKRLIARAEKTGRVHMTMDVTKRWRVTTIHHEDSGQREEISPVRERRFKVTLLMERTGGDNPEERVRLLIEEGESWTAWIFDGRDGWYLVSDASSYPARDARSRLSSGDIFSTLTDELEPIEKNKMVPLWPFVDSGAFRALLRNAEVSPGGQAPLDAVPCRIVRIERRFGKSVWDVCKLWMPEGDDRVVKVEYTPAWARDFVEQLTPEELAQLGTFCVVTSYEEPASFEADAFDPAPLLKRWSDAVAANVARDLKELEQRRNWIPPGGFGGGFDEFGAEFGGFGPEDGEPEPELPEEGPEQ
jgi:hypothetical protein